jgi:hypothetical protein
MTTKCQAFRVAAADTKNLQSNRQSSTRFFTFSTQQANLSKESRRLKLLSSKEKNVLHDIVLPSRSSCQREILSIISELPCTFQMIWSAKHLNAFPVVMFMLKWAKQKWNRTVENISHIIYVANKNSCKDMILFMGSVQTQNIMLIFFFGNTSLSIWLLLYSLDTLPKCLNITILIEAWNWCR